MLNGSIFSFRRDVWQFQPCILSNANGLTLKAISLSLTRSVNPARSAEHPETSDSRVTLCGKLGHRPSLGIIRVAHTKHVELYTNDN